MLVGILLLVGILHMVDLNSLHLNLGRVPTILLTALLLSATHFSTKKKTNTQQCGNSKDQQKAPPWEIAHAVFVDLIDGGPSWDGRAYALGPFDDTSR